MKRLLSLLLAAVLAALAFPPPAQAHAALARSTPEAGATLEVAPTVLRLEFTERLDPAFSRVQLFDAANALVAGAETVSPDAPYDLALELPALGQGSYTALWRVRSAEDGHVTEGSVPFGVGVAADLGAMLPPVGAPAPALTPPPLLGALGRWLALVGAALAVGALGFGLLVWRPAVRAAAPSRAADAAMGRGLRRLMLLGAGLVLLAGVPTLLSQAANVADPDGSLLGAVPALLAGFSGLVLLGRALAAAALIALALRLSAPGSGSGPPWWLALAVGGLLLLTFPLSGHGAAAGVGAPVLIAAGLVHVAAMALWLGGLPPLLVAVRQARDGQASPPLRSLVQRFTPLAMLCILLIAVSGTAQALVHVGSPDLLLTTTYGRALLVKLAAFIALVGLGALHWLIVGPRLRPGGPWAGRFRWTLAAEAGLGLLVLAAAGVQLNVAPSRAAIAAQEQVGQRLTARVDHVDLVLWVSPGHVGDNVLALDVADRRAGTSTPPQVLFRFEMPGMEMGTLEAQAAEATLNRFETRGSYLTMVGRWNVEAIVRRPGMDDVRHIFAVDVRGHRHP
jgi:copper transport protein